MSGKRVFVLLDAAIRRRCADWIINSAPVGWVVSICEASRTLEQNAAQWPYLDAFSKQLQWPVNGAMCWLTPEEFKKKIDEKAFIEWEEVYEGNFYGTLKTEIERVWSEGKNVIFDVDVKGGLNLKKYFGDKALAVFVKVPSEEVLKERLHDRGTETPESLSRRLFKAKFEMSFQDQFDVVLVNEVLDRSLAEAQQLYDNFKKS